MKTRSAIHDPLRRRLLSSIGGGLGALAASSLLGPRVALSAPGPHFPAKAKRAIWLFMAGAPSQLDLFDYKPGLTQRFNEDLPASIRQGQRLTGMTSGQARFPVAPSRFAFSQHGQAGTWV